MKITCFQESDGAPNLAKFRRECGANFLGLGINGCSRNLNKNPKPNEQAINLGKFVKEIDGWRGFLGLGIDSSSNYEINHGRALNPTPLRSYHPTQGYKDYASSSGTCCNWKKRAGPRRRSRESHPEPINPPEELVQKIGPNIRPVFLYRKQLEEWDTQKHQNRLFMNDRKKLMDFMTEEERLAVEDGKKHGIDLVGFDSLGREYGLHSNKWESLDKVVVNGSGWSKILTANGAEKGDWVHLWAFRRGDDGQFCLFVDFRHQP